jgi:outer membrane biosynthesis protein TonB
MNNEMNTHKKEKKRREKKRKRKVRKKRKEKKRKEKKRKEKKRKEKKTEQQLFSSCFQASLPSSVLWSPRQTLFLLNNNTKTMLSSLVQIYLSILLQKLKNNKYKIYIPNCFKSSEITFNYAVYQSFESSFIFSSILYIFYIL